MKKRNSLAILVLSSAFLLASCGEQETPSSEAPSSKEPSTSQTSVPAKTSEESKPEPSSEPVKTSEESKPEPSSEPKPEPSSEPAPEPSSEPEPEPSSEPAPEPSSEPAPVTKYTVTFDTDGGSVIDPVEVVAGEPVARPAEDPTKDGFVFIDWFEDSFATMVYDFSEPIMGDTTIYAGWQEVEPEPSSEPEPEPGTLYFREATWWNAERVVVRIALDPEPGADFASLTNYVDMEYERFVDHGEDSHYSYYTVDLEALGDATTVQFWRGGTQKGSTEVEYWGAQTSIVDLSGRGDSNMYDLLGVGKPGAWDGGDDSDREVVGSWGTYDPSDVSDAPVESSEPAGSSEVDPGSEPYGPEGAEKSDWYIVGDGARFSGWDFDGGLQLWTNPANAEDKGCALNVYFAVGDLFKVTDGSTWFGYEGVDTYDDPSNAGLYCFEGVGDGYGGQNFSCTVEGFYDVYVNGSGVFWIQAHA